MGLLDNVGAAPSINFPTLPIPLQSDPALSAAPAATPQAQSFRGLKKPPPAVGATVNGYTYMGGDPRSKDPSVWAPASGDTFLNSLPLDDTKKTLIKAIANYELPPGSARGGLGSPEVQQVLGLAKQYDPTFSAPNYQAVQKARTEIGNPDSRFNLTKTALNTAIAHAVDLMKTSDQLNNSQSPTWNGIRNAFDQYVLGDPRQGNFDQNARLLGGEVVKAVTGAQGGGEGDRKDQTSSYAVNGSPEQQQQAIGKTMELLKAKLDELTSTVKDARDPQYTAASLLSPTARQGWEYLQGRLNAKGAQPQPQGAQPSPQDIADELRRRGVIK